MRTGGDWMKSRMLRGTSGHLSIAREITEYCWSYARKGPHPLEGVILKCNFSLHLHTNYILSKYTPKCLNHKSRKNIMTFY